MSASSLISYIKFYQAAEVIVPYVFNAGIRTLHLFVITRFFLTFEKYQMYSQAINTQCFILLKIIYEGSIPKNAQIVHFVNLIRF